jgi:hypothetical protein
LTAWLLKCKSTQESGHRLGDRSLAQRRRTTDAQQAARRARHGGSPGRHAAGQFQQGAAARQARLARVGQAQAPGAAVEQPGLGPLLHLRQVARHHRARHVEHVGGASHAAFFRDHDKYLGGSDSIHDVLDSCN